MTSFRSLSRMQRVAWIGASVLFGVLCITPAIFIRLDPSVTFRGIEMQGTDAEYHYAARVQEIRDGFGAASSVYYADTKEQPYLQPPVPEAVISALGNLFRLDAARSLLLSQFLFGAGVFFVMTGCVAALTRRFWWSLFGTTVMLFAGYLFSTPLLLLELIRNTAGSTEFLTFARPVNPQWSGMLFYGTLWAFAVWVRSGSRRALVVTGVLTVLSIYSYLYIWTLLGAAFALVGVWALARREWVRVRDLALLAGGIALGAIPYAWGVWNAMHHPWYAETSMRFGMVPGRHIEIGVFVVAFLALAWIARTRLREQAVTVGALALAALIALNQQLVTGKIIVASHYHWYFIKPTVVILFLAIAGSWAWDRYGTRWFAWVRSLPVMIVAFGIAVCLGGLYQWRSYEAARPFWRTQQDAASALTFIRGQLMPGKPVYARGFIRDLMLVYTSADVYWGTNAHMYLSPDVRARDAYFFDLWMDGVSAKEAEDTFFTTRRGELSGRLHSIYYRELAGRYDAIPDEEVRVQVAAYADFLRQTTEEKISRYPLTYTVLSRAESASPAGEKLKARSVLLYADDSFEIRSFGEH